ncbi:MAG: hypothetical protein EON58_11785 [Alphaproteobacteria bacterium]|nr:MAG: hypothetical protein EON58_11785 [Alphaproteobacteria bacterium]
MVVDGQTLANRELRKSAILRLGQLAGRVGALIDGELPRLLVVVTHRDLHEPDPVAIEWMVAEFAKQNVSFKLMPVASFSENAIKAGDGLAELIQETVGEPKPLPVFWPGTDLRSGMSSFLSYRRDQ